MRLRVQNRLFWICIFSMAIFIACLGIGVPGLGKRKVDSERNGSLTTVRFRADSHLDSGSSRIKVLGRDRKNNGTQDQTSEATQEAFYLIRVHGDFSRLRTLLRDAERSEQIEILTGSLNRLQSRLGNRHDVREKLMLIEEFGGDVSHFAKSQVLRDFGGRINPESDIEFIRSLGPKDWEFVAKGAAEADPRKAIDLINADIHEFQIKSLVTNCMTVWLDLDSNAVSEFIGKMPEGAKRDLAVKAIVQWLVSRNDLQRANEWQAFLSKSP